jgi:esterase/lipase
MKSPITLVNLFAVACSTLCFDNSAFAMRRFFSDVSDASSYSSAATVGYSVAATPIATSVVRNFVPLNMWAGPPDYSRTEVLERLQSKTVSIATLDGIHLDGVWSQDFGADGSAVVIFHGNACTANSMLEYAEWYRSQGISVLLVTMRGYPGSEGNAVASGELGFYHDAAAAIQFLIDMGYTKDKVFAHGYSLGGVFAAAAGYYFDIPVILDHTFTNASAEIGHFAKVGIASWIPLWLTEGIARGAFPSGSVSDYEVGFPGFEKKRLVTDGLNTLNKVQNTNADLLVIYGENDPLMPCAFANAFFEAKRKSRVIYREDALVPMLGGHWGPFMEQREATDKVRAFLRRNALLKRQ